MGIHALLDWFAGGRNGYMTLVHCMNHDYLWIAITVLLDLCVAMGYALIALHWRRNERKAVDSPAKAALRSMQNIFLFCGISGYIFIPVKMFWPAWRLYDLSLVVLTFFTWRYALQSRQLGVVYNQLGRSDRLARELEESREEGIRKSFFLNALSHDLRTPLNGIALQAELASMSLDSNNPEEVRESIEQIKSCSRVTADLLNSFLELGKLDWSRESMQIEQVDLRTMLDDLAERSRARAGIKGLSVIVEAPTTLALRTDRVKLGRILDNFLDNALKYCDEGGVRLIAETSGSGVAVSVVDTGKGIAFDDQARIFDDFVQIQNRERDSRKGFGLGLAIARRLAYQLGGQLDVESVPGRGSRFTVHLPAELAFVERAFGQEGRSLDASNHPAAALG